jgi:hypothetical protein
MTQGFVASAKLHLLVGSGYRFVLRKKTRDWMGSTRSPLRGSRRLGQAAKPSAADAVEVLVGLVGTHPRLK